MISKLSKSPIFALVVVAVLAAGTVLLAGYVDKSTQGTAVTTDGKCDDCPKAGTAACCEVSGACEKDGACASSCENGTCESECGSGCEKKAESASCSGGGCAGQMQGSCGAGGCALTQ